tara:strand:+ start:1001 stop:1693 length:693 start_codon:yes stop_codon:yes gene_type:complete
MIDQDIVQRIKVMGIFALQFYKVLTGTMLTLFVPQACSQSEEITDGSGIFNPDRTRICSISDNLENDEIYHRFTLYFNSISFLCFIYCYILELRRESWAIKYLDIDNDKPDNCLKEIIVKEPKLDKHMDRLNKLYFYGLSVTAIVYMINIILMINILYQDYHSASTLSCFFSFTLLVTMKLYNSLSVAYYSVKDDKMMSAFMSEFVSFNVLDKDYILDKQDESILPKNNP